MSKPPAAGRSAPRVVTVGRALCAVPFLYLAATVGYALLNYPDFAGALPQFLRYVAAPSALAALFAWAMVAQGGRRAALFGAYGCAVLAALFLFEAVATSRLTRSVAANASELYAESAAMASFRQSLPPGVTARAVAKRIADASLDTVVLGAIPHRDTLLCTGDKDHIVSYRADRYGFNNPDEVYSTGALDIAIFGDSFIEGMCLDQGLDVASRVREFAPKTASFGFRGAGPLMELAALGRFGRALKPKLSVVVYFAGNDWENLEAELRQPWLRKALDEDADFGDANVAATQIAKVEAVFAGMWSEDEGGMRNYRLQQWRNLLALSQTWAALGLHYPAAPKSQPEFATIIARMRQIAATWGGEVLFVFVPRVERFRGGLQNDFVFDQARKRFFSAINAERALAIDLTESFESDADPLSFYAEDGHFNPKGAAYLASLIIDYADDRFDDPAEPEVAGADPDEAL